MQREYPDRPLVGVGALIVDAGLVALINRGHEPLKGEWSIPGGLLEVGETLRQAAEREAFEETGLVVRATELLGVFDRVIPDDQHRTIYHYVLIDFLCEKISGDLSASGDAAEARWFPLDEIEELQLTVDTVEVIRTAIAKASNKNSV